MGDKKVAKRIGELAGEFDVSIEFVALEQMKLFCRDVIKKTGGNPSLTLGGQKKAGKAAIEKDLNNIFIPKNKISGTMEPLDDGYIVNFTSGGVMAIRSDQDLRSASKEAIGRIHRDSRDRKGRTRAPATSFHNGLKNPEKYVVKTAAFNQYKREVQAHVFTLKAGWVKALESLEAKTNGRVSGVPDYIRSLQNRAQQSGLIKRGSGGNIELRADNRVKYAGRTIKQTDLDTLGRTRQKDIFGSMAKRMDQVVERYNKG